MGFSCWKRGSTSRDWVLPLFLAGDLVLEVASCGEEPSGVFTGSLLERSLCPLEGSSTPGDPTGGGSCWKLGYRWLGLGRRWTGLG